MIAVEKIIFAAVAVMTFVVVMAGGVFAASLLPTVTVTGTVADTCTSPIGGAISFNIDPSGSGTLTPATTDAGNTAPTVKCTKNSVHAVTCTSGHSNKLTVGNDGATDPITYSITGCPATITGGGFSTATAIDFGISILQADYQDALAGAHADTITVTVSY